jgi:hypothetical protein
MRHRWSSLAASARWRSGPPDGSLSTVTAPGPNAIIEFFEQRPEYTAQVLREHVDDGTGHCAGCAWQERARPTVPCLTRHYAELATQRPRRT